MNRQSEGRTKTKESLRTQYREARRRHHGENKASAFTLAPYFEEVLHHHGGTDAIWGIYKAHRSEFNLEPTLAVVGARWPNVRWAYPVVTKGDSLDFMIPRGGDFIANSFLILEPNPETGERIALPRLAGIFIPALAFDRFGNRIGSGKGFYDRALKEFRGIRVGVGYSVQISEDAFPAEQHDIQMDFLLTEQGVVKCERLENPSRTKG